jgi:hypothetical protein
MHTTVNKMFTAKDHILIIFISALAGLAGAMMFINYGG